MATNLLILPRVNLTIQVFTNEDWQDRLAFYDLNGNPISLDGIAFALECRRHVDDAEALISISTDPYDDKTGGDLIIEGDDENILHIAVPMSKMLRVPWGGYVFDATGNADGMQRVILTGTLTVIEGVTR